MFNPDRLLLCTDTSNFGHDDGSAVELQRIAEVRKLNESRRRLVDVGQISSCVPSSTTRSVGMLKNFVAVVALSAM